MAGVKKPRGIRHDRHCHRCRIKSIKCDLNRPQCQSCLQTGLPCHYPQRVVWIEEKRQKTKSSSKSSSPPSAGNGADPINGKDSKDITINLYGFIDLLSRFYQEIQFSKKEIPKETIELISQTLSFARSQLVGTDDKNSIQSHLSALTNLRQVIESAHPVALFGIATFAIFEVCCGSFGRWHRHLQGARSLLDLHCSDKTELDHLLAQIPGLADVLSYLVWFDVTGALVREGSLIFDEWHRRILSPSFLDSVGCPPDAFELFVHVTKRTDLDTLDICSQAMCQVLHLDSDDLSEPDRRLAATVYRCTGAMVAFRRARESHTSPDPSVPAPTSVSYEKVISSLVDRVCDAVSKLPYYSRYYVHLATPIYLAGVHATATTQCEVLRTFWRNCRECEFPRYPDGQEQCEQMWRRI
ncbi:hypothetical protein N7495_009449 [Penicillium taxi]|uniref:uncharacterized protein n=1 Tax=Penicillium taxi TaxID=168475 RepID=UPI00254577F1|nr:uncharacterized protein N7495_009449 [Penicillium taxi]KAJ5884939.1 hypothetical protein N7495_009449 [Penicillium taxi]